MAPIGRFLSHLLNNQIEWNQWIGTMIEYKGYVGCFKFDERTNLFHGRISNIQDSITFQGNSIEKTHLAFQDAVDQYIAWCQKYRTGKKSERYSPKIKFTLPTNSNGP